MAGKKLFLTIIISLLVLGAIFVIFSIRSYLSSKPKDQEVKMEISSEEKNKIENWILENDLNQYGDPKGAFYSGGTPLFDEATGKTIDRYDYIIKKHPSRPWNK